MLKQNRPSFSGKLSVDLHLDSEPSQWNTCKKIQRFHTTTCVIFRNAIQKSTLDHLLYAIYWDRQQGYGDEKDNIPAPLWSSQALDHAVLTQCQKPFCLLLDNTDVNPWNLQPLVPASSCFLPLENSSEILGQVHQLPWALLPHFTHLQTSPTGLFFPKHTSYSPMSSLLFQEDLYFPNTLPTWTNTYLNQHPPLTHFIFGIAFTGDLKLHYFI